MFEFLRGLGRSAEDKRTELLNSFLDGDLSASDRAQLEAQLQQDAALRAELAQLRLVQQQLRAMPRRRVPRSFTLDPALYGAPKPQRAQQVYPLLRGATVLTALLFVVVLGLGQLNLGSGSSALQATSLAQQAAEPEALPLAAAAVPESEVAPEAAAAAIVIEEAPAADAAQGAAAESGAAEELLLEPAAPAEAVEESAAATAATADAGARKELDAPEQPIATAQAALGGAAPQDSADEAVAAYSETVVANEAETGLAISWSTIALWLGLTTLLLALLTLLARSRSRT